MKKKNLFLILFISFFAFSQTSIDGLITDKNVEYYTNVQTRLFQRGKPVFIVLNVQTSKPNQMNIARREAQELKKNFSFLNTNVYFIDQYINLSFDNREKSKLYFNRVNEDYQRVIFWDGNPAKQPVVREELLKSSEEFGTIYGKSFVSSYIEDYNVKRNSFADSFVENITPKSKEISDKYISNLILSLGIVDITFNFLLPYNNYGFKKITVNSDLKGYKNPFSEIYFNENKQLSKIILQSDDYDKKNLEMFFTMENGLYRGKKSKVVGEKEMLRESSRPLYNDDKMFVIDDDSYIEYYLKEGILCYKYHYFNDDLYEDNISEFAIRNKTLAYIDNDDLNSYEVTVNSFSNFFPAYGKLRDNLEFSFVKLNDETIEITDNDINTKQKGKVIVNLNKEKNISKMVIENIDLKSRKQKSITFTIQYE